jgi:copper chaperone CopZ
LESTPGVISAEVSHEANSGAILATEAVSKDELIATVINAGFTVNS